MNMGWRYYNHALLPTSAPHEKVNVSLLADKERGIYEKVQFIKDHV